MVRGHKFPAVAVAYQSNKKLLISAGILRHWPFWLLIVPVHSTTAPEPLW